MTTSTFAPHPTAMTGTTITAPGTVLTVVAAVSSALIGGVFFAFSAFVLPALRNVSTADGIRTMQSINRSAVTPPLMIALFGTAAVCIALLVRAVRSWGAPGSGWLLAGALLYLVLVVLVTAAGNVPLNDSLARLDAGSAGAAAQWSHFLHSWTLWNHVRMIGGLAAGVAFVVALLRSNSGR